MADPIDPAELALVQLAITLGRTIGGCCEWKEQAAQRIRAQPPLQGLTPEGIKNLLCEFVSDQQGKVTQVLEKRKEKQDHRFYYKAIVPVPGHRRGLFVEMVLVDHDPEYPVVLIVNAHEQGR